jgi:hypothetical protein
MNEPNVGGGESAFARRRRLYQFVRSGETGKKVLDELMPEGVPHNYERSLWDYKSILPSPLSAKPSMEEKKAYDLSMAGIIKDAVAFYNSYGGYLVIGIDDKTREVVGWTSQFDATS